MIMDSKHKYYPTNIIAKLGYLIEECGEVMAAAGKSVRWGLDGLNPEVENGETNREWLLREISDLEQAIKIIKDGI